MARFIRNQIIIIRDRDYNLASRCLGISTCRIIFKNLLPYLVSVITHAHGACHSLGHRQ